MKIVRDDGKDFSNEEFAKMIADSRTGSAPIKITAGNGSVKQTYNLNYHGGARYPHLLRDATKPDILSEIIRGR